MTVSTVKSVNLTNLTAAPRVLLSNKIGAVKVCIDKIELATTSIDEIGDIITIGSIPSNAIIKSIKVYNDDLDSHGTPLLAADVGLYYTGIGGNQKKDGNVFGTVVDADCFATAITTLQAANVLGVEVMNEVKNIDDITKEAWEIGGLTVDCGGLLALGLTVTAVAATAAAGGVTIVIEYL